MCGRYASSRPDADLVEELEVDDVVGEALPPSWNVAPTQDVRSVLERPPRAGEQAARTAPTDDPTQDAPDDAVPPARRQLRTLRWGLVPSWAKDLKVGSRMINARAETITEKPSFRAAAGRRRCLVPADGYYEWQSGQGGGAKTPWFLRADDGAPLTFAGLYELWRDPARGDDDPDRWVWSLTVVTSPAQDALGSIHERTPLVVPPDLRADWLSTAVTALGDVRSLVEAMPEPHLLPEVVSTAVNSVRNDGPELVHPV